MVLRVLSLEWVIRFFHWNGPTLFTYVVRTCEVCLHSLQCLQLDRPYTFAAVEKHSLARSHINRTRSAIVQMKWRYWPQRSQNTSIRRDVSLAFTWALLMSRTLFSYFPAPIERLRVFVKFVLILPKGRQLHLNGSRVHTGHLEKTPRTYTYVMYSAPINKT